MHCGSIKLLLLHAQVAPHERIKIRSGLAKPLGTHALHFRAIPGRFFGQRSGRRVNFEGDGRATEIPSCPMSTSFMFRSPRSATENHWVSFQNTKNEWKSQMLIFSPMAYHCSILCSIFSLKIPTGTATSTGLCCTSPSSRPMKRLALKMVRSGERPLNVKPMEDMVIVIPYCL